MTQGDFPYPIPPKIAERERRLFKPFIFIRTSGSAHSGTAAVFERRLAGFGGTTYRISGGISIAGALRNATSCKRVVTGMARSIKPANIASQVWSPHKTSVVGSGLDGLFGEMS